MKNQKQDPVEFDEEADFEPEALPNGQKSSEAVLNASDWTTETILVQLKRGNIDMNPQFQRRDAWTISKKSRFIESVILGLPIPQIVLAERQAERGRYIVLDGKQRLLSLLQFTGSGIGPYNAFKLSGLEIRRDLNGQKYASLQGDLFSSDTDAFLNQTIRTVVIKNWPNADFLHMVFLRLNTSSVALSPQELRQALFPGEFTTFLDERSANSAALKDLLRLSAPDFRMRDVELLLRHIAFIRFLEKYSGNLRGFLDSTCQILNTQWEQEKASIDSMVNDFEEAIFSMQEIFGQSNSGRKWLGEGYESRLNRAVLDIMTYYFSKREIRQSAVREKNRVVESFQALCVNNPAFLSSIESTTKSLGATFTRLSEWGNALQAILDVEVNVPKWDEVTSRILP